MIQTPANSCIRLAVAILAIAGAAARGAVVELRARAYTCGPQVRLRDVADLRGAAAVDLAGTVIAQCPSEHDRVTVTRAQIETILSTRGVNWGKLSLCGYDQCIIERQSAPDTASGDIPPLVAPVASADNPKTAGPATLRAPAVAKIEQMTGAPAADLKIVFSPTDERALAEPVAGDRIEVTSDAADTSGRLPLVLRRYRGDRVVATIRVAADVSRRYLAVAATHDISRGDIIGAGDVELQPLFVGCGRGRPATALDQVVGRTSSCFIRSGAVIFERQAVPGTAIHRGDLITVRAIYGELVVTTLGRALQDGSTDQIIPVRHEPSHKVLAVRVTAEGEGIMVTEMTDAQAAETRKPAAGGPR
jgi:flagella basal body P-ring formation protein FlgA